MRETTTTRKAVEVYRKTQAALARGRDRINAERKKQGEHSRAQVYYFMRLDQDAGKPSRGQARRIRRRMDGALSESQIRKIISRTRNSVRVSQAYPPSRQLTGGTPNGT